MVAAAAAIGLGSTLWIEHEIVSMAGTAFFVLAALGLLLSGRLVSRQSRALVALSPVFGVWLSIRTSPWLIPLDVVAASGLLVLGAVSSTTGALARYGLRDLAAMPVHLAGQAIDTVGFVTRAVPDAGVHRRHGQAVAVGLVVAIPIVIVIGSLLASGDRAFADLMNSVFGGANGERAVIFGFSAVAGLVALRVAAGADAEPRPESAPRLGAVETITVLVALIALHAMFALAQLVGSVAPDREVLASAAETRAWVHRGFFPLLWASGVTLAVLVTLRAIGHRSTQRHRRWFTRASVVVVALTLVVVGVAVHRIAGYSDTFGLTMLRLYSLVFACWIGLVFVFFALSTAGVSAGRRWFAGSCAAVGLAALFALNVANPEARVVDYDIDDLARYDERHLVVDLSEDAIPALVGAVDELPPDLASSLRSRLCSERHQERSKGGLDWNRSRAAARDALAELCR